jgi:hypothetical protein
VCEKLIRLDEWYGFQHTCLKPFRAHVKTKKNIATHVVFIISFTLAYVPEAIQGACTTLKRREEITTLFHDRHTCLKPFRAHAGTRNNGDLL